MLSGARLPCSNPSSAIPSCVNWDKLLHLFMPWCLHLENDVKNSSAYVVVVRVEFTDLFIKH